MAKIGGKLELKRLPVAAHSDLVQTRKAQMAFWIDSPIQPDVKLRGQPRLHLGPIVAGQLLQF